MSDVEATTAQTVGGTQPAEAETSTANAGDSTVSKSHHEKILTRKAEQHARAVAQARQEAAREAAERIAERLGVDPDEIDAVGEKLKALSGEDSELRKAQRELKKLAAERDALAQAKAQLIEARNAATIQRAIAEHAKGCQDLPLLTSFLERRLRVDDDGTLCVVGDDGEIDRSLKPEKFIKSEFDARPYLAAAPPSSGAGSRPSNGSAKPRELTTREAMIAHLVATNPKGPLG